MTCDRDDTLEGVGGGRFAEGEKAPGFDVQFNFIDTIDVNEPSMYFETESHEFETESHECQLDFVTLEGPVTGLNTSEFSEDDEITLDSDGRMVKR